MDVEGTEFDLIKKMVETRAVCLVDEMFVECHYNRWKRSMKYQKRYKDCLELFSSLMDIVDQFVKHFEGFLGISPEVAKFSEEDCLLFEKKASSEDAEIMIKDISNDEIKKALFDIEDNKAPRPDEFTSRFFKKSWEIIKDDFCAAIKEFFESGKLLRDINATLIALVPKSTTPQKAPPGHRLWH
nr:RNA-directed DNA polymerase, eukaryota, reverse transcriptase zinc-binding domain protein [Tanacetum cinerariifolium]